MQNRHNNFFFFTNNKDPNKNNNDFYNNIDYEYFEILPHKPKRDLFISHRNEPTY